jgi:HD-GYP domain-containing protein (c-di-GMP phosphodiesterase class II)
MIRYSALLHDVGKIGLPTHILSTKARLTEEEFNLVKQHPVIGHEIVKPISFLKPALDGILYHHERWDGHGYPKGLAGEDIPFMGRLLTLADTWDAMAHDRFYRRARSPEEIVEELRDCSGTQFDPNLVPTAVEVLPSVTSEDRVTMALKESE